MHVFLNGAFDLALFCHRNHTYFITGTFHITWQINEKLSIKEILCLFTFKKMYLHYNFIVILIKKKKYNDAKDHEGRNQCILFVATFLEPTMVHRSFSYIK